MLYDHIDHVAAGRNDGGQFIKDLFGAVAHQKGTAAGLLGRCIDQISLGSGKNGHLGTQQGNVLHDDLAADAKQGGKAASGNGDLGIFQYLNDLFSAFYIIHGISFAGTWPVNFINLIKV